MAQGGGSNVTWVVSPAKEDHMKSKAYKRAYIFLAAALIFVSWIGGRKSRNWWCVVGLVLLVVAVLGLQGKLSAKLVLDVQSEICTCPRS